jgi:hypothetical protein
MGQTPPPNPRKDSLDAPEESPEQEAIRLAKGDVQAYERLLSDPANVLDLRVIGRYDEFQEALRRAREVVCRGQAGDV